jgi:mono/diheme cytochrome c family protein
MRSFSLLIAVIASAAGLVAAQSPRFHLGRPPTPEEIKAWDIAVGPDGEGLPPGSGTAVRGKEIFAAQCARCHGATGREGPEMPLVGGLHTLNTDKPLKTVGSYWPYATTLWDYINRAMPFDRAGVLNADDVYATVAYVLFLNDLVHERDVIDARTLPGVRMPNRDGFIPDPRPDVQKSQVAPANKGHNKRSRSRPN